MGGGVSESQPTPNYIDAFVDIKWHDITFTKVVANPGFLLMNSHAKLEHKTRGHIMIIRSGTMQVEAQWIAVFMHSAKSMHAS